MYVPILALSTGSNQNAVGYIYQDFDKELIHYIFQEIFNYRRFTHSRQISTFKIFKRKKNSINIFHFFDEVLISTF